MTRSQTAPGRTAAPQAARPSVLTDLRRDDLDTIDEEPAEGAARRRRGAALEDAIRQAAFDELSEVGYAPFSVESVAVRARTGKASIYRRWPTKQALVLDALCERMPTAEQCGLVPDFDESVTTAEALRGIASTISRVLNSPSGHAMRAIKCEAFSDPELAREIDDRFQAPRRAALLGLLQRGVERGEVRPDAVTPLVADVIPAMLAHRIILMREEITEADLTQIVDQILLPLISTCPGASAADRAADGEL